LSGGDLNRVVGEEVLSKDFGLKGRGVYEGAISGLEGGVCVDLLAFPCPCQGPDVFDFCGMVELLVCPVLFCLDQGLPMGFHSPPSGFSIGGGMGSHMGCHAVLIPPLDSMGFVRALGLEGEAVGLGNHVIEEAKGVEESVEEVQRGNERATDGRVGDPASVCLCLRGWVMG